MSIQVPDSWAWSSYKPEPTASVMIGGGWECEAENLTAQECREYARRLRDAAQRLDTLRVGAGLDRMTNYFEELHEEPFLPFDWLMEFQPHKVDPFMAGFHRQLEAGSGVFLKMLRADSWADGTGVIAE